MFSPTIRVAIFLLLTLFGVNQLSKGESAGWIYLVSAVVIASGYFRYSNVWAAWRAAKKGDFEHAEALIAGVHYPRLLSVQSAAYYRFILGMLAARAGRTDEAIRRLEAAATGELRTSNDHSIAWLTLAEVHASVGDVAAARERLQQARETPHKEALDSMIDKVESELSDRDSVEPSD